MLYSKKSKYLILFHNQVAHGLKALVISKFNQIRWSKSNLKDCIIDKLSTILSNNFMIVHIFSLSIISTMDSYFCYAYRILKKVIIRKSFKGICKQCVYISHAIYFPYTRVEGCGFDLWCDL